MTDSTLGLPKAKTRPPGDCTRMATLAPVKTQSSFALLKSPVRRFEKRWLQVLHFSWRIKLMEDFYDKLVNDNDEDDFTATSSSFLNLDDDNDSDEAKAFAKLSIGEDSGGENGSESIGEYDKTAPANTHKEDKISSLVSSNSVVSDNVIESKKGMIETELALDLTATKSSQNSDNVSGSNNGNIGTEVVSVLTASKISGSGGSGVKEVQWSAFNSDSLQNGGNGFGSYSDLFGEFGDGGSAVENLSSERNIVSDGKEYKSAYLDNAHNHSQYQEGQVYGTEREQTVDVQDLNYWENLYPGWLEQTVDVQDFKLMVIIQLQMHKGVLARLLVMGNRRFLICSKLLSLL